MLLHAVHQRLAADVEIAGGVGLVPVETFEGAEDQLLLDGFQADALRREIEVQRVDRAGARGAGTPAGPQDDLRAAARERRGARRCSPARECCRASGS